MTQEFITKLLGLMLCWLLATAGVAATLLVIAMAQEVLT